MNYINYGDAIQREDAMEWLLETYDEFPKRVPRDPCKEISNAIFKDWRWVLTQEGEIVFGNCCQPGILKAEFGERKPEALGGIFAVSSFFLQQKNATRVPVNIIRKHWPEYLPKSNQRE